MEISGNEVAAVREVAVKVEEQMIVLRELELSLVGGGSGDVALG